jgi:ABC-type nitrate/sulfonate/bicarbonate transport system substrate-binding protein
MATRLIVFPGAFNWPVWVAEDQGFFAQRGIEVAVTNTPGSVFQVTQMIEGKADLAITLIDNVIAYREGQGEVPLTSPDLIGLLATDTRVFPALVTLPEVKTYADLRGRTLSVDAKTTGYANVVYAMLEAGGLNPDDYKIESVGGVLQRFDAILEGKHAGALFNSPFEGLLLARGFTLLDTAIRVVGGYQGMVLAARRQWAEANRPTVVAFIRAFLEAVRWLYEPANRDAAFAIYSRYQPDAAPNSAATAYGVLFDPKLGFPADGRMDLPGLQKVIELRARYGRPRKTLDRSLFEYYDPSFLDAIS